jgi:hypothetical protein
MNHELGENLASKGFVTVFIDSAANWKGFKPRTAVGLTLEHAAPAR